MAQPTKTARKIDESSNPKSNQNSPKITQPKIDGIIPEIIGMPPFATNIDVSQNLLSNSMMIASIEPCKPNLTQGLTLFSLTNVWDEYAKLVQQLGFSFSSTNRLSVAFMGDSLPSETFSNEYSESFLSNFAEGISSGAAEITQMTGSKTATEAVANLNKALAATGPVGETISTFLSSVANSGKAAYQSAAKGNKFVEDFGAMANKLVGGARIDFPMIWKGSNYTTSYSFTVRLYNPSPASKNSLNTYIIGPLAALLALACPVSSDNGETFTYPYFCRINCPGLFLLNAAAISSISVTKGGDAQLVGLNQRLGMVDVRLEIIALHNSMVHTGTSSSRPTLKNYLDNLRDSVKLNTIYKTSSVKIIDSKDIINENILTKPSFPVEVVDLNTAPESRVSTENLSIEEALLGEMPDLGNIT